MPATFPTKGADFRSVPDPGTGDWQVFGLTGFFRFRQFLPASASQPFRSVRVLRLSFLFTAAGQFWI